MFAVQFEQGPSVGDNFNMTHPLFLWVAKLNNLRRAYPALQLGAQSNLWSNGEGPGLYAFSRRMNTQEVFVVLNTATTKQTLPPCAVSSAEGSKLLNLFETNETCVVSAGRTPSITIPGTSARIYVG